jgi:hypothetical protein
MPRFLSLTILAMLLLPGCTAQQVEQLQSDEHQAESLYAATTQATATARQSVAALPPDSPARAQAERVLTASGKAEQTARLALDVAKSALDAAQKKDPADPALKQSLTAAISAIPSPWTPVLASLIPAAVPLAFSLLQSVKLGRAHQTVAHVTQQLEEHKAALEALSAKQAASSSSS